MTKVAAIGECMIELSGCVDAAGDPAAGLPATDIHFGCAGDTYNTLVYLRRLLPARAYQAAYISAVGTDPLSERMIAEMEKAKLVTKLVQRISDRLPGMYWIVNDNAGEREFLYWRSTSAARKVLANRHGARVLKYLNRGDWLFLSGISFAILTPRDRRRLVELIDGLRAKGVRIAYDANYRPRLWKSVGDAREVQLSLLGRVDTYMSTAQEETAIFGDADLAETVTRLSKSHVPEWIIRISPGVVHASSTGEVIIPPIDAQLVLDTTGAGDAFDAAYLAARLQGADQGAAVAAGEALAALVVQHQGAILSDLKSSTALTGRSINEH